MTSEVGSGQVAIFPTFKGFRKNVTREVDGATTSAGKTFSQGFSRTAGTTGSTAGRSFSQGFTTNSSDLGTASLKTLQAQVRSTTQANSRARLAEQDAIGKVNVAQAAYNATVNKYAAGSVQSVRSTENLASAQRKAASAGDIARGSFSAMTSAQASLKAATENSSNSVQKQGSVFSGLGSRIGASISDGFGGAMQTVVGLVGSGITAITGLAVVGATAVGVTIGAALTAGFSRLTTIETAQAKLKALGNTSQDIAEIMTDANNAVLGTQYSLADAVTAAASATAAGVKPGKDLTKYLKLQANAAAVAGVDFSDLGLVMNQVQSQNKAYTQDLNQVASRGIPIYQSLAKVYGVTQEGLRDMLQKGEVDAAHFRQALELNVGNAADEIGKTTVGSFENMKAAFTRFGAALLAPAFPAFAKVFNSIKDSLDKTGKVLQPIIAKYAPKLAAAFQPFVDSIGPGVSKLIDDITGSASSPEGQKWFSDMGKALKDIGGALKDAMPSLLTFLEASGKLVAAGLLLSAQIAPGWIHGAAQISDAFSKVGDNVTTALAKISDGTFWDTVGAKFDNGWKQIKTGFERGWDQIVTFLDDSEKNHLISDAIGKWFENLGPGLANGWNQIVQGFSNGKNQINDFLNNSDNNHFIADWFGSLFAGAGVALGNGWSQIMAGFGNGWAQLTAMFANGWGQIVGGFANGWTQIVAGFSNGGSQIVGAFSNGMSQIVGGFSNGWSQIVGGFANGWTQIVAGVSAGWSGVTGAFRNGWSQITGFFSGASTWLYRAGADVVAGFAKGILDGINTAVQAAKLLANSIPGPIKKILGIASPSRVMRDEVGIQIGAGIVQGLEASQSPVSRAMSELVSPSMSMVGVQQATGGASGSAAASPSFPEEVTLRDVDGSILARTRLEISRSDSDRGTRIENRRRKP